MIPTLLWRCPLCATDDALAQIVRPLRGDLVRCRACRAEWRLRRIPGDDFYMRLTHSGPRPPRQVADSGVPNLFGGHPDDEHSVATWYAAMKATVRLTPIHAPAFEPLPGETLFLASGPATLQAEETDPLFFPVPEAGAAGRADKQDAPACHLVTVSPSHRVAAGRADKRAVRGRMVGSGRLFLTDRRLAWQGEAAACDFPLARLNSAYALMADGLVLMVEMRLVTVRFRQESLLKWVTFIGLIAPRVETATGHRIAVSHF
jgi:hypothetical protein